MNGPVPTMFEMLMAMALESPRPRDSRSFAVTAKGVSTGLSGQLGIVCFVATRCGIVRWTRAVCGRLTFMRWTEKA